MRRLPALFAALLAGSGTAAAQDRAVVTASEPSALAVTVYRDPARGLGDPMNADNPRGFAMISETRRVTLPPGRSTIRFDGVSEGMVAVSAIVTGLPGGTIEKNRNAQLLSPAALVDGTLGNRVTITRTNPATGVAESEQAVVRTRADDGLVLQTSQGFEAVRCSGLPEKLAFDGIPAGLSAEPVFTVDTRDDAGGSYEVTLTYLSWGFDWEANYVATLGGTTGRDAQDIQFDLLSWLSLVNDNGQSFENAELMVVAGTLNVVSDFLSLTDPPDAEPLVLTCYPLGSTAAGSPVPFYGKVPPPPPPPPAMMAPGEAIVVTGSRVSRDNMEMAAPVSVLTAEEESLGNLKLYRVPLPVDVNARGMKQVAFLNEQDAQGNFVYEAFCDAGSWQADGALPAIIRLETVNDEERGLGRSLPSGTVAVFERTAYGNLLVAEESLRDFARGQDVFVNLGDSSSVFFDCRSDGEQDPWAEEGRWLRMRATLTNANPYSVTVRLYLGYPSDLQFRGVADRTKYGQRILDIRVPANGTRETDWRIRPIEN